METSDELKTMASMWSCIENINEDSRARILTWINQKAQSHSLFTSIAGLRAQMPISDSPQTEKGWIGGKSL